MRFARPQRREPQHRARRLRVRAIFATRWTRKSAPVVLGQTGCDTRRSEPEAGRLIGWSGEWEWGLSNPACKAISRSRSQIVTLKNGAKVAAICDHGIHNLRSQFVTSSLGGLYRVAGVGWETIHRPYAVQENNSGQCRMALT